MNNLRYANYTTLIASSLEGMRNILRAIKCESQNMGLFLNMAKTKILTTDDYDQDTFQLDGNETEVVKDFNLLGLIVNTEATSTMEVKRRIAIGKSTMKSLDRVFKSKDITLSTKIRLTHSLIFSIATYAGLGSNGIHVMALSNQDTKI